MPNPWENDPVVSQPQGQTGFPGVIPGRPKQPAPPQQRTPEQVQYEQGRVEAQDRAAREWNATHNPDGSPKDATPVLSESDRAAVIAEAKTKLRLIDSLEKRSKEEWFATGFGSRIAGLIPSTDAYNVQADVETVAAAGALQRIMELSKANGGKNPLTPISNADFIALSRSVANLDPAQSDDQFQRNLKVYRDIYTRALQAAEVGATPAAPAAKKKPPADIDALLKKYGGK